MARTIDDELRQMLKEEADEMKQESKQPTTLMGRWFQEADDDSDEDEGESLEDIEKDMDNLDSDDDEEDSDDDNDEDDDDVELGRDNSDVQNEYDEEELTTLNKLIADEQEAIQGYFDAAEKSKQDVLIRLYSDIGKEERFHTEQLLYAKAELTGEKYEPSDPEVKKEYEELLNGGMDEETAMYTVADKHKLEVSVDDDGESLEDIEKDIESLEESFYQTTANLNLLMEIQESSAYKNHAELRRAYCEFAETVFVQEAVDNIHTKQGRDVLGTNNPFLIIGRMIRSIYNAILNLVRKLKMWVDKRRLKSKRTIAWIKKHGISGLFANGVKLYFWNDQSNSFEVSDAVGYLTLLLNSTELVRSKLKIHDGPRVDNSSKKYEWIPQKAYKTPTITSINDAMNKITGTVFTKTKVIVNESNSDELETMFFGFSEGKMYDKNVSKDDNGKKVTDITVKSINIYNVLSAVLDQASKYSKATDQWMTVVQNQLFSTGNNVANKDPSTYKECVSLMKTVCSGYAKLIKIITADLNECMKLDKGLLAAVEQGDKANSQLATDVANGVDTRNKTYDDYGDNAYGLDAKGKKVMRTAPHPT